MLALWHAVAGGKPVFAFATDYSRQEATRQIRLQALAMAGMAPKKAHRAQLWFHDQLDDRNWKAAVSKAAKSEIFWDSYRERFATRR